jgi:predicted ATPase
MLTHLRIKNFKAWEDSGDVRLAPLTVIFGTNSAGKSSIGHLLLALKQTVASVDRRKALHLGDSTSLIDLGTYEECVHQHDINRKIGFELAWKQLPDFQDEEGDLLQINVDFEYSKTQPRVFSLSYIKTPADKERDVETIDYIRKNDTEFVINPNGDSGYSPIQKKGKARVKLPEPEKFFYIPEETRLCYQNLDFLSDHSLETKKTFDNIYYLGPLRENPRPTYSWAGDAPEDVGEKGQYTIAALLAAATKGRHLHYPYQKFERQASRNQKTFSFQKFIAKWMKQLKLIDDFLVEPVAKGRKEHEVIIRTNNSASKVRITDVGFGISQVLPALVEAFYTPKHSTVLMEQPEIHLHPQVQAELADAFIEAVQIHEGESPRDVQLIIESHSEHFLTRLQRRVAEEKIKPEEVAIYFVDNKDGKAVIEPLRLNEYGEIENWPENFFGDEMGDLVARTQAAIKRRQQNQGQAV